MVIDEILACMRELACDPAVAIDPEVAQPEADTGFRNTSLANNGIGPVRSQRVVDAQAVRRIDAIMMTCGH